MLIFSLEQFPISFGIEAALADNLRATGTDRLSPDQFVQAVSAAFSCVHPKDVVYENLEYLCLKTEELLEKNQEPAKEITANVPTVGRLGPLSQWLQGLTAQDICMYVAAHDPIKAKKFYWEVSKDDVLKAFENKAQLETQKASYIFEGVLYGMGGKYKDEGAGPTPNKLTSLDTPEGWDKFDSFMSRIQ